MPAPNKEGFVKIGGHRRPGMVASVSPSTSRIRAMWGRMYGAMGGFLAACERKNSRRHDGRRAYRRVRPDCEPPPGLKCTSTTMAVGWSGRLRKGRRRLWQSRRDRRLWEISNVASSSTGASEYSSETYPYRTSTNKSARFRRVRRTECFWGTDLTPHACAPTGNACDVHRELPGTPGPDKDCDGQAICDWLGWMEAAGVTDFWPAD